MKKSKIKVYVAGPWFTENQDKVQTSLEEWVRGREDLDPFFPRHDGVKLDANQIQDETLRKRVFSDNIENIIESDLVIANLDGRDGYQDTGTVYEIGYAQAFGIPVLGFQERGGGKMYEHMSFLTDSMLMVDNFVDLERSYRYVANQGKYTKQSVQMSVGSRVLLAAPGNNDANLEVSEYLRETLEGMYSRVDCLERVEPWVTKESADKIFNHTRFLLADIDDREPVVSWAIGQAYARGIPVITYSDNDYGINIMLLLSIANHVKGREDLEDVLEEVKLYGIGSLAKIDTSQFKAY